MIRSEKSGSGIEKKASGKKVAFFVLAFVIGYLTSVTVQVIL